MTSPQLQPLTIQHQRVLTPAGQTIQTLSTAPTTVHTVQQQVQQVPVSNHILLVKLDQQFQFLLWSENQKKQNESWSHGKVISSNKD